MKRSYWVLASKAMLGAVLYRVAGARGIFSTLLVSALPISVGDWGLRERAAVILFAPLGINAAHALTVSVLYGLVLTVLGGVGAIIWVTNAYCRISSPPVDGEATQA